MDKYYNPIIEEFHQGFEYEIWESFAYTKENWIKETFQFVDKDEIWLGEDPTNILAMYENRGDEIRVKYLDKEGIESLGFISSNVIDVLKEEAEFIKGFEKNTYILYIQEDKKLVIYNQKEYDISNKITGNWTEEILFKGYIKNKSELIKLLKQLGIG